ncbi:NADH dehydrogenase [Prolixibacter denitrificans]|nr:NADH dehydrogenase [Prolixibacter denitrificans]
MGAAATKVNLVVALYGIMLVAIYGASEGGTPELGGLGLTFRLDPLSMLMYSMIALLGFIIIKFSRNYLDGDARHGVFMGRLSATIAAVQFLVLSGNLLVLFLSWVLTSLMLHRLLIFYPERRRAVVAARKKFIVARLGDLSLLVASILIYLQYSTGNLETIFKAVKESANLPIGVEIAALLLAIAALLKSAQFPTHGWLIEVMETPTPVSALLHAGLLNAGPFLMIRMAFLVSHSIAAPVLLIIMGALTALIASVSYMTQASVKTALGYSSVAHMGFMLLVCGIGVYPAAMLHLVSHSFYKAHAFLASGSTVDTIRASRIKEPRRTGNPIKIAVSIFFAFLIYFVFSAFWGIDHSRDFALLATGAIVVMGLSQIIAPALDSDGYWISVVRASLLSILVALLFFSLESVSHYLLHTQLPELIEPNTLTKLLIVSVLAVFAVTVFIQIIAPVVKHTIFWQKLGVHFRNGFYVNAFFDRLTGAFDIQYLSQKLK